MRAPKIYIETSVFNFYCDENRGDKHTDTLKLFEAIRAGKFEPYTSEYVVGELEAAPEPKKSQMLNLINQFNIKSFTVSAESERLAQVYIAEKIIPPNFLTDAVHIAITSVKGLDYIVSYNFRHIVKRKTIEMTDVVNVREGYKRVGIYSPTVVIENDDNK